MKNLSKIQQMTLSGLFIACGLVLPMAFHSFPNGGRMFLPMHIPVLLAGLILSPSYSLAIGVLTPILSNLFTGMPPTFPMLPIMIFELGTYGFVISFLKHKLKLNFMVDLILAMISGRIIAGAVVFVLANFFAAKLPPFFIFIMGSVTKGLPGIILQLVFVPALYLSLNRFTKGCLNEA